jgi:thymidylate synthase
VPGRTKHKIFCEAMTRTSIRAGKPRQCKSKGYFTPTNRRFLCCHHAGNQSTDTKTRKYKGLFKNTKVPLQNKINRLKNLINFRNKTDEEIKQYILSEQERSKTYGYRTKFYTRHFTRWRNRLRNQSRKTDQLEDFIQLLRSKPKV